MLTKTELRFTIIFALILIVELYCGYYSDMAALHYFTKPLIVLSLLIYFFLQCQHLSNSIKLISTLGLVFSLIGDVALLFDAINPIYFVIGLGSFLLAHVMYILIFLKQRERSKNPLGFIILMLMYAAFLFSFLKDNLGDLLIPVIIYMLVILTMATSAFLRVKHDNNSSYYWVFVGAILFMISDSVLALNKFYQSFQYSSILIMSTYAMAQYCIVLGILKHRFNSR